MWYFAWLLGLPLAALMAVVNAIWLELQQDDEVIGEIIADSDRTEG